MSNYEITAYLNGKFVKTESFTTIKYVLKAAETALKAGMSVEIKQVRP